MDLCEEITVAFVAVVAVLTRPRCGRSPTEPPRRPKVAVSAGAETAPSSCVDADSVDPTQTLAKESIEYEYEYRDAEYEYEYEASFDVEPLRGWALVMKPGIREATARLTPKALHNIAQGRDSAPWVAMRPPRSANPNGVLQRAGWGPEATFPGSRFRPDPSRPRTAVAGGTHENFSETNRTPSTESIVLVLVLVLVLDRFFRQGLRWINRVRSDTIRLQADLPRRLDSSSVACRVRVRVSKLPQIHSQQPPLMAIYPPNVKNPEVLTQTLSCTPRKPGWETDLQVFWQTGYHFGSSPRRRLQC